uniref:oligopeptide/dipeptide ABC transporter ATP-binding protein n=1 Tax=Pantoea vagans TaxID=470934 RepID=UPI003FA3D04C
PTLDPQHEPIAVIKGEIPDPSHPPSGCRFSSRCPRAEAQCREAVPELREASPGHHVACHLIQQNREGVTPDSATRFVKPATIGGHQGGPDRNIIQA